MARSRNLKPGFFKNEALAELPPLTRLLFSGLWGIADRKGRLEDRPKRIRAELLPYDDGSVDAMLDELHQAGFILRYQHGEQRFIQVVNFAKHQNPHVREPESTIPAPGEHSASTVPAPDKHGTGPADSLLPITSKAAASRGTRLPQDWEPDDNLKTWASKEKPDVDVDASVEAFRDYWIAIPGSKGVKLDWDSTFRNWVRKERSYSRNLPSKAIADPFLGAI